MHLALYSRHEGELTAWAYADKDGETLCKFNAKGATLVDFVQGFHHAEKAKREFIAGGGTVQEFEFLIGHLTKPDPEMIEA